VKKAGLLKVFYVLIVIFFMLFSNSLFTKEHNNDEMLIEKHINELEEMKRGYESKAIKYANQAERLQFVSSELQTAKKYWILADKNKKIAEKLQKIIDDLKATKSNMNQNNLETLPSNNKKH